MRADTIAALASPPGPARRGILRLSGERTTEIVSGLWRGPLALARRTALEGRIFDGAGEQPALLYWMPGPRSYTREDVAELHLHGSPPLLEAALARALALGARAAEPGEFTRRAFESGRIDLVRAEGVLELVRARNEGERRAAAALLFGGLSRRVAALGAELVEARALCEASLDFEEGDTGHVPLDELVLRMRAARAGLAAAEREEAARPPPGGAPRVVLAGAPNAGKSRLFNALIGEERVLVSALAGTTRDAVVAPWRVGELVLELRDTAGVESDGVKDDAPPTLDARAQGRAREELLAADLVLWVVDASRAGPDPAPEALAALDALPPGTPRVLVWSQVDRADARPRPVTAWPSVALSAADPSAGDGIRGLARSTARALEGAGARAGGLARELSQRHREALASASRRVDEALAAASSGAPLDQLASLLRQAADELGTVDGRTSAEDVLSRIFARFCIGK